MMPRMSRKNAFQSVSKVDKGTYGRLNTIHDSDSPRAPTSHQKQIQGKKELCPRKTPKVLSNHPLVSPRVKKQQEQQQLEQKESASDSLSTLHKMTKETEGKHSANKKGMSKKKIKATKAKAHRDFAKHGAAGKSFNSLDKRNKRGIFSIEGRSPRVATARSQRWALKQQQNERRPETKASKKRKKKKSMKGSSFFRMSLSECNDDLYLRIMDVPWFCAQNQERFRANTITQVSVGDGVNSEAEGIHEGALHSSSVVALKNAIDEADDGANNAASVQLPLPSERILSEIDAEILSFGAYVKLTPSERHARCAFLEHITELASSQFSNSRKLDVLSKDQHQQPQQQNNHRRGDEGNNTNVHIAPYGSFATQEVCTFASDVDMCLWGVVEDPERENCKTHFVGEGNGDDSGDDRNVEDDDSGGNDENIILVGGFPRGDQCPRLTESSLLKTMDALQAADNTHRMADETENFISSNEERIKSHLEVETPERQKPIDCTEEQTHGQVSDDLNQSSNEIIKDDTPLFFIDRVGEEAETNRGSASTNCDDAQSTQTTLGEANLASRQSGVPSSADTSIQVDQRQDDEDRDEMEAIKFTPDPQFVVDANANKKGDCQLNGLNKNYCLKDARQNETKIAITADVLMASGNLTKLDSHNQTELRTGESPRQKNNTFQTSNIQVIDLVEEELEPGMFSSLGDSAGDAIEIFDESESSSSVEEARELLNKVGSEDDDSDSADKMSSFYSRRMIDQTRGNNQSETDSCMSLTSVKEREVCPPELSTKRNNVIESSSDAPNNKAAVIELSLTSHDLISDIKPRVDSVVGPTGKTRVRVISALQCLTNLLRRSSFTNTIECRSKARVPIINCRTCTGFEGDIAIGGHNGLDTSEYATSQVNRFSCFAPIVLLLKILLVQQGLDKPFTGGLGSFKLYVLISHHIECHLANGGSERPSEILMSFFFRYGGIDPYNSNGTTDLEQLREGNEAIISDGGLCDLSPVFRLNDCVAMFRECYERLSVRCLLSSGENKNECRSDGPDKSQISYLSSIVDCFRLSEARETSDQRSKCCDRILISVACRNRRKVNGERNNGQIFPFHGVSRRKEKNNVGDRSYRETRDKKGKNGIASNKRARLTDDLQRQSSQKKFLKRGSRGAIIPVKRPDIEARRSLCSDPDMVLAHRAMKKRKNKRKQTRDIALRSFASRRSI